MAEILVTRDVLAEDAVFILENLRDIEDEDRSTHMMDVRSELAGSVTLDFSEYLRFLRKFGYVTLDRDAHTLGLTPLGQEAAEGGAHELEDKLAGFFADTLKAGVIDVPSEEEEEDTLDEAPKISGARPPPPPPPEDFTPMPGPPPPPPGEGRSTFADVLAGADNDGGIDEVDELVYLRGEPLGEGALGIVYLARHASLGYDVAIKEIRKATLDKLDSDPGRFKAEVSRQAGLRHPGVVGIFDLDLTVPQPFAVLELCGGGSLRDRIEANGGEGLNPALALRAFGQLLAGLAHAHGLEVLHENLKASNVLFDAFGNAKLADFGLSRLLSVDLGDSSASMLDAARVSYIPPELMRTGQKVITGSKSGDVYALGIILYELLTGQVPGRRSPLPSEAIAGVPKELDDLFDRMVADRAEDRPADAGEVLDELIGSFPDGTFGSPGLTWVATAPFDPSESDVPKPSKKTRRKKPNG